MKAILLGILAAFFFAFTFIFNRMMSVSGGYWIWSASLRYFFMLPMFLIIVGLKRNLRPVLNALRGNPARWILWSTIGFGMFYAPICFSSAFGPAWLVAGTWQITIVAGTLLTPLFYENNLNGRSKVRKRVPKKGLLMSLIILIGIGLMQLQNAKTLTIPQLLIGLLPVVVAAFAYPLGNRKMMEFCGGKHDVFQRVLGMTLASLPFWLVLSCFALFSGHLPTHAQLTQSTLVALFSGLIATALFFAATDLVRENSHKLAAVEATQAGEVVFTVIGEWFFFTGNMPSTISLVGIGIVIIGMILHSLASQAGDETNEVFDSTSLSS